MAVTDSRICPLASLRLYDPGQGDPVVTDRGLGWYDVLAESALLGTYQRDAAGEMLLEFVEGVGIVCRPFLVLQDTLETRWDFSGGTWEERKPATGSPRKYRLCQLDTTANLAFSATLDHNAPANPSVAFSFVFVDTPPDHNATTYPPYCRIELGHNSRQWALEFSKVYGARLLGYNDTTSSWEPVANLPEPERPANADNAEALIVFRVLRDQIAVSVDRGRNYTFWPLPRDAAGAVLPIRTGPVVVRGQGGMLVFGMHQVRYYTGHYTSPARNTLASRTSPTATISGRYSLPPGTSLVFSDQSTPAASSAKWRATFTPKAHLTASFSFYSTPELYAAQFTYPVARDLPTLYYTTPWDGAANSPYGLTRISLDKPYELASSCAKVRIRLNPQSQFTTFSLRWRKAELLLGELDSDGTTTRTEATWAGYIAAVETEAEEYNSQDLSLELVTLATILQRQFWTDFDRVPLGGQTVNQALNDILTSCGFADYLTAFGIPYSYVSWHALGDNLTLPSGTPEEPFEWPPAGESKWETMVRIAGYAGLEIAVLDDGTLSSGPQKYISPFVTHQFRMVPDDTVTDGLKRFVKRISLRVDYREAITAVITKGVDLFKRAVYGWARDTHAETFPLSDRYSPFRELIQEDIPYTVDPGAIIAATRAQALAVEGFPLKYEPDIAVPVNLDVVRRDRGTIVGSYVGIADWHEFGVLTLHHEYRADDPGFARMETHAGLRRVYP